MKKIVVVIWRLSVYTEEFGAHIQLKRACCCCRDLEAREIRWKLNSATANDGIQRPPYSSHDTRRLSEPPLSLLTWQPQNADVTVKEIPQ